MKKMILAGVAFCGFMMINQADAWTLFKKKAAPANQQTQQQAAPAKQQAQQQQAPQQKPMNPAAPAAAVVGGAAVGAAAMGGNQAPAGPALQKPNCDCSNGPAARACLQSFGRMNNTNPGNVDQHSMEFRNSYPQCIETLKSPMGGRIFGDRLGNEMLKH